MFRVTVSSTFNAVHSVTMRGIDETPHNHEWKVAIVIEGASLDADGLLINFVEIERQLEQIIKPLKDSNLNEIDTLGGENPSAERVAIYIGDAMMKQIGSPVRIQSVIVTEAENCQATYEL